MNNGITICNPLEHPEWDTRLRNLPDSSIFHSAAWARVLTDTFGYKPQYFCSANGSFLSAAMPVMEVPGRHRKIRGKSLPFTDFCEPISSNKIHNFDLMELALKYGRERGWKRFDLRGGSGLHEHHPIFCSIFFHTVDLEKGEQDIYETFRSSTKRNIKKAISGGVEIIRDQSLESVKAYYRLHCLTKKRQGIFPQPFLFFRKIHEHVLDTNQGHIALAVLDGKPVAGTVIFHWNKDASYVYGASDLRYQHYRPHNLLMWDSIRWHARQGFKTFTLGVTDLNNDGLRQYKKGLSPTEEVRHYYRYDFEQNQFLKHQESLYGALRRIVCRKMPVPVLRAAGTLLYKYYG